MGRVPFGGLFCLLQTFCNVPGDKEKIAKMSRGLGRFTQIAYGPPLGIKRLRPLPRKSIEKGQPLLRLSVSPGIDQLLA